MQRSFRVFAISICVAVMLAACGPPAAPDSPPAVAPDEALLTPLRQLVEIRRADSDAWAAVIEPVMVGEGDSIRTGVGGIALVNFGDYASAELHPNTIVTLTTFDAAQPAIELDQRGGQILNRIDEGRGVSYTLKTPSAQSVANGTVFWTWVRTSGASRYFSTENSVLIMPVSDLVEPFDLPAGRCVDVNADGVPGEDCSGDPAPQPATAGEPVLLANRQGFVVDLSNCGDGTCDSLVGENRFSCGPDCNKPRCGNQICEPEETFRSCEQDCTGVGGTVCGDNICQPGSGEDYITCQADCDAPPLVCGDGLCSDNIGEDIFSCPADCAPNGFCGDNRCQADENIEVCFEDCAPAGECGDGICDPARLETIWLCSEDCKLGDICPNGKCDAGLGENAEVCPADCAVANPCGDGVCNASTGEDATTCAADCAVPDPCGDGVCDASTGEDAVTCAVDCAVPDPCGDGVCDASTGEDAVTCAVDCAVPDPCGDGVCDASTGEDETTCAADCAVANPCGDGVCDASTGEDAVTCAVDCAVPDPCGDGVCDASIGEDETTCAADCAVTNPCGDGVCDASTGEDETTCPADCAPLPASSAEPDPCGDGVCDVVGGEDFTSCPADCVCGDGLCDAAVGEDETTCPADCPASAAGGGALAMTANMLPSGVSACLLPVEPPVRGSLVRLLWLAFGGGGLVAVAVVARRGRGELTAAVEE